MKWVGTMRGRYLIEADVKGVRIDVRLNDVPLFGWPGSFNNKMNWFVNQWIVTGNNHLAVEINEAPRGFDPKASVKVELNYYEYDPQAIIGKSDHKTIASVQWAPPDPPDAKTQDPNDTSTPVDYLSPEILDAPRPTYNFPEMLFDAGEITTPQPEWLWTKGDVIEPTPENILAIVEHIERLVTSIRERDAAAFDEILGTVFTDVDTAYGLESGKTAGSMIVKKAWLDENWDIKDIDPLSLKPQLQGDGRLLELTQADGGPILQAIDGLKKNQFKMRLWFAQVDGTFLIAR